MFFLKKISSIATLPVEQLAKELAVTEAGIMGLKKTHTSDDLLKISREFLFAKFIDSLKQNGSALAPHVKIPSFLKQLEIYFGNRVLQHSNYYLNLINDEFQRRQISLRVRKINRDSIEIY